MARRLGESWDATVVESLAANDRATLEKYLADAHALEAQAIQMLQRGRADYLIYEDTPAEAYVARNGGPAIQPLLPAIAREGLYLTLAHRSRCNTPELRGRLARAVYKLSQERVMNRLVEQGFVLWRKQPSL